MPPGPSGVDSHIKNMRSRPSRYLCRLEAWQKLQERYRFVGAPLHGVVAQSDGADSEIHLLQPKHGRSARTRSSGRMKKPCELYHREHDSDRHVDGRPQDGYAPMERQASIGRPT